MLNKLFIQTFLILSLLAQLTSPAFAEGEIAFSYPLIKPELDISSDDTKAIREKIAHYDTLIAEFKQSKYPLITNKVIEAYYAKGNQHKKLSEPEAAINSYNNIIAAASSDSQHMLLRLTTC